MGFKLLGAFVALLAINVAIFYSKEDSKQYVDYAKNIYRTVLDAIFRGKTPPAVPQNDRVLTVEELSKYDGNSGDIIMLAVMGRVFDVSRGAKHYGPGGGYHFFAGRDASRAYVSGDFTDVGLTNNIEGLKPHEFVELDNWVKFYEKDYKYVGRLAGYFYDSQGYPTAVGKTVEEQLTKGRTLKAEDETNKKMFPMCNSEWSQEKGGTVYCSKKSGGVERAWEGVPRYYFRPGILQPRCACVKPTGPPSDDPNRTDHGNRGDLDNPSFKQYPNCHPESVACKIPDS